MKRYVFDYFYLFTIAGAVVLLDQWTKFLIRTNLAISEFWSPWSWLTPYARLVHWQNSGAAFGMLQGLGGIFTILAILVAAAIVYYFPQVPREDWLLRIAMGLQLGGALGNLIDRLTKQGFVTDFISLGNFPVFNIADASISIGTALLILGMWLKEHKSDSAHLEEAEATDTTHTSNPAMPEDFTGE